MDEFIDEITKEAITAAEEDWDNIIVKDWPAVKYSATVFLSAYNSYNEQQQFREIFQNSISSQLQQLNKLQNGSLSLLNNKNYGVERAIYLLAFKFQSVYQKFIGELPSEVLYVTSTGNIYKGPIKQMALTAYGKSLNDMRVGGLSQVEGFEKLRFQGEQQQRLEKLQDLYKEIRKKMDTFYTKLEAKTKYRQRALKELSPYYYKRGKKYQFMRQNAYIYEDSSLYRILNYGDLGEALIAMIYTKKGDITIQDMLKAAANVKNIGAFFEEDVLNFAVKTEKASLPGLQQFVNAAQQVMYSSDTLTRQDFQEHKAGAHGIIKAMVDTELAKEKLPIFNTSLKELVY